MLDVECTIVTQSVTAGESNTNTSKCNRKTQKKQNKKT